MKATNTYLKFVEELKQNIISSRYQAMKLANKQQLLLYLRTGKMLEEKIDAEKWGANVVNQISQDLQKHLPGLRGFSRRNLMKMKQFYNDYQSLFNLISVDVQAELSDKEPIVPSLTAQLSNTVLECFWSLSFSHHILLLSKCKAADERLFYIVQACEHYWSVNVLEYNIESNLYEKQGRLVNNFSNTLNRKLTPAALNVFRDEYLLDFISVNDNDSEREIEHKIVIDIRDFILRMGIGFSFIGNQYRIELDDEEFFIDLLFFNRNLQSLIAIELKRGKFKPEYAGQMSFYLTVLDDKIKLPHENSSIGIILCKEKNNTIVEYAIKSIDKAMGVATFKTSKDLPKDIKKFLPDEAELKKLL
jgi:predicted nuclease of restriction endonuclease-like (RecB) superfamily